MVSRAARPFVAVTGRRLGKIDRWPHEHAMVAPGGYIDALGRAGAIAALIDPVGDPSGILDRVDALVLTGGADLDPACYGQAPHPKTYGVDRAVDDFELALAHEALARELPTLAICRGFQVLNAALGGTLYQHIPEDPGVEPHGRPGEPNGGRTQEVTIEPGTLLGEGDGHEPPGRHLPPPSGGRQGRRRPARRRPRRRRHRRRPRARRPGGWLLAVQWHPEDTAATDPANQRLFDALVAETR